MPFLNLGRNYSYILYTILHLFLFSDKNEEIQDLQKVEVSLKDPLFSNDQHNVLIKSHNDAVFKELHNDLMQKYEYELSEKDVYANKFSDLQHPTVIEDNHPNITFDEHLKEGLKETFVDDTSSDCQYSDESSTQDSYSVSEPTNNDNYIMNEHFPFIPASEWARLGSFGLTSYEENYEVS